MHHYRYKISCSRSNRFEQTNIKYERRCCIADLPPCRPSPRKVYNIADLPPEDLQHCRPSPIFVKFRILIFGCTEKHVLNIVCSNMLQLMIKLLYSVMYSVFSIKLRQVTWICKDKTYNGRNDMGEGLQWFFSTIADLPGGGEVCNGGNVCNITVNLQTSTVVSYY